MNPHPMIKSTAYMLIAVILSSCVVGPDYVPPEPDVSDQWGEQPRQGLKQGATDLLGWWKSFGDAKLDELIERAVVGNYDLHRAVARISEARAGYGVEKGAYWPQVDATGSYSRFRTSENSESGGTSDSRMSIGFGATWELDLFGRIARSVEAASAVIGAAEEDYGDVLVSLTAEVAINYVRLRALQRRVTIAKANARTQAESLGLARSRLRAGLVPDLDVAQAETNLANTESTIPGLRAAIKFSIHRIGVLLGEQPQSLRKELESPGALPTPPLEVAVGVPGDLLAHRPDIRRAERDLAAQTARIGVATADLYPSLTLNGFISLEADSISNWFEGSSRAFSAGPAMRWPLFTGGQIQNRIKVEEARTEQAMMAYRQVVLAALEDVENSMVAYIEKQHERDALMRSVDAATRSSRHSETLYRDGLSDFQNVLDSQRALLRSQDALAQTEGEVTISLIDLFRSLGGGWGSPASLQAAADTRGE